MSLTVKLVTSHNPSYYIKRSARVDTLVIGLTADTNVNPGAFYLISKKIARGVGASRYQNTT